MAQRIAVVSLLALSFCLICLPRPLLATIGSSGMPHTIAYKLEPESVNVGSTVKITGTLIPSVDVESLVVYLGLPHESGAEVSPPLVREWRGEGKKGKAISISGDVVFHKPGWYGFFVMYAHPHPRWRRSLCVDGINFIIRVPGGIETRKTEDESFGEEPAPPDTRVVRARRVSEEMLQKFRG